MGVAGLAAIEIGEPISIALETLKSGRPDFSGAAE